MKKGSNDMTRRQGNIASLIVLIFFIVILAFVTAMNIKNTQDLRYFLEDSVQDQLVSISIAAREALDIDAFVSYEDASVTELDEYQQTLSKLRQLQKSMGAEYIYALKELNGEYVFVFDTDEEDEEVFIPYELSRVHEKAFQGYASADIMNVDDDYGSFNTGAVPIIQGGQVVGIICADIVDHYMERSISTANINSIILIVSLLVTMAIMFIVVVRLLRRVWTMQEKLEYMAHHDNITGLPNRQYLLDYLDKATKSKNSAPFALFFIDLDNFKTVNDNAGHDAGDELLRHIAQYLESSSENAQSFRPSAGKLNIAARIGGDEFVQVIRGVDTAQKAGEIAQKLLDGFITQYTDRYVEKYNVGMSIGVAVYPLHTESYHVLIKYADLAMYEAKNAGKNQYKIYNDEMSKGLD